MSIRINEWRVYVKEDNTVLKHKLDAAFSGSSEHKVTLVAPATTNLKRFTIKLANGSRPYAKSLSLQTEEVDGLFVPLTEEVEVEPGEFESWYIWEAYLGQVITNAVSDFNAPPVKLSFSSSEVRYVNNPNEKTYKGVYNNTANFPVGTVQDTGWYVGFGSNSDRSLNQAYTFDLGHLPYNDTGMTIAEYELANDIILKLGTGATGQTIVPVNESTIAVNELADPTETDTINDNIAVLQSQVATITNTVAGSSAMPLDVGTLQPSGDVTIRDEFVLTSDSDGKTKFITGAQLRDFVSETIDYDVALYSGATLPDEDLVTRFPWPMDGALEDPRNGLPFNLNPLWVDGSTVQDSLIYIGLSIRVDEDNSAPPTIDNAIWKWDAGTTDWMNTGQVAEVSIDDFNALKQQVEGNTDDILVNTDDLDDIKDGTIIVSKALNDADGNDIRGEYYHTSTIDVTDLSLHSVEELADLISKGSGSIITTVERNLLNSLDFGAEINTVTNVNGVFPPDAGGSPAPDEGGKITLTKSNIGLNDVDNTSDIAKPLSQDAIDANDALQLDIDNKAFKTLIDVQGDYTGHAGFQVRVNDTEDGLDYRLGDNNTSTGVITGMQMSQGVGNTFTIQSGVYAIVDLTNPEKPVTHRIEYPGVVDYSDTTFTNDFLTQNLLTYISLDIDKNFVYRSDEPTGDARRLQCMLGIISHLDKQDILAVQTTPVVNSQPVNTTLDFHNKVNHKSGDKYTGAALTQQFNQSAGILVGYGINYDTDELNPNIRTIPGGADITFSRVYRDGIGGLVVDIFNTWDPSLWDDGSGILQSIPTAGPGASTVIHNIYTTGLGTTFIIVGQQLYSNIEDATTAITAKQYEIAGIPDDLFVNAILRSQVAMTWNAADFSNSLQAIFIENSASSSAGGGGTLTNVLDSNVNITSAFNNITNTATTQKLVNEAIDTTFLPINGTVSMTGNLDMDNNHLVNTGDIYNGTQGSADSPSLRMSSGEDLGLASSTTGSVELITGLTTRLTISQTDILADSNYVEQGTYSLTTKGYVDTQNALYLPIDGSLPMTGDLSLGNNDILGVGVLTRKASGWTASDGIPAIWFEGITTSSNLSLYGGSSGKIELNTGLDTQIEINNLTVEVFEEMSMNANKITNLLNPTNPQDAVSLEYLNSVVGIGESGTLLDNTDIFPILTSTPVSPSNISISTDTITATNYVTEDGSFESLNVLFGVTKSNELFKIDTNARLSGNNSAHFFPGGLVSYKEIDYVFPNGDKIYFSANALVENYVSGDIRIDLRDFGTYDNQANDTLAIDGITYLSVIKTASGGGLRLLYGAVGPTDLDGYLDNIKSINLTEVFGAGNEPDLATADRMFNTYFQGTQSSEYDIVSRGYNIFDGRLELGTLDQGFDLPTNDTVRSANFIKVKPSSELTFSSETGYAFEVAQYDVNRVFISELTVTTITLESNTEYIRFRCSEGSFQNNLNERIQIEYGAVATTIQDPNYSYDHVGDGNNPELGSIPYLGGDIFLDNITIGGFNTYTWSLDTARSIENNTLGVQAAQQDITKINEDYIIDKTDSVRDDSQFPTFHTIPTDNTNVVVDVKPITLVNEFGSLGAIETFSGTSPNEFADLIEIDTSLGVVERNTDSVVGQYSQFMGTPGGPNARVQTYDNTYISSLNDIWYASAFMKSLQGDDTRRLVIFSNDTQTLGATDKNIDGQGWVHLGVRAKDTIGDGFVKVYYYNNQESGGSNETLLDGCTLINLTKCFGSGNEPSLEEMDLLIPNYFENTQTTEFDIVSRGKNIIDVGTNEVTINGLTITNLGNGRLKLDGQPTIQTRISIYKTLEYFSTTNNLLDNAQRIDINNGIVYSMSNTYISGNVTDTLSTIILVDDNVQIQMNTTIGNGNTFDDNITLTQDSFPVYVNAQNTTTFTDYVFEIQLEESSTISKFEPYIEVIDHVDGLSGNTINSAYVYPDGDIHLENISLGGINTYTWTRNTQGSISNNTQSIVALKNDITTLNDEQWELIYDGNGKDLGYPGGIYGETNTDGTFYYDFNVYSKVKLYWSSQQFASTSEFLLNNPGFGGLYKSTVAGQAADSPTINLIGGSVSMAADKKSLQLDGFGYWNIITGTYNDRLNNTAYVIIRMEGVRK